MRKIICILMLFQFLTAVGMGSNQPDSLIRAGKSLLAQDPPKGIRYLDQLLRQYPGLSDSLRGIINSSLGSGYAMVGDLDSAKYHLQLAIKQLTDSTARIYAQKNLASVCLLQKDYGTADSIFTAVIEAIPENSVNNNLKAGLMGAHSNVFAVQGQNRMAIELLKRALMICQQAQKPDTITLSILRARLAEIYFNLENYGLAAAELEKVLDIISPERDLYSYTTASLGLAHSLLELKAPNKAGPWLQKGLAANRRLGNKELEGYGLMLYGCYYDLSGMQSKALDYFKSSYELLREKKSTYLLDCATAFLAFLSRNRMFERGRTVISDPVLDSIRQQQTPPQLLKYMRASLPVIEQLFPGERTTAFCKEIISLQDTVTRMKLEQSIVDSKAEFRMMEQEQEKKRLEQDNTILAQVNTVRNIQVSLAVIAALALVFIIMYLVVRHRGRSLKQQLEIEQTRQDAAYKEELLAMEVELRSMREKVIEQQKNELLSSVSEIEQLRSEIGKLSDTSQKAVEELFARHLTDNRGRISLEQFLQQFNMIFPKFFPALSKSYPSLSNADLQFCALIRMNFSIKDISAILHIEPKSTYKKKYRIEEKMELGENCSLEQLVFAVEG